MISERVVAPPTSTLRRGSAVRRKPAFTLRPNLQLRAHLVENLGRSVLVQLMLAMSFVAFAAMLYLAQASQASVIQFDLATLTSRRIELNAENAGLASQANQLQALQRIDTMATTQLHMSKPDLSTTVWVRPVVPHVPRSVAVYPTPAEASMASSPAAWIVRFLLLAKNSL